ncbi:MAG: hypothetical protein ABMA00_14620, partial [Gemmatimonas sp.]
MTILLALLDIEGAEDDAQVHAILSRSVDAHGATREHARPGPGVLLAAKTPHIGGRRESKLAADDRYTVIADATLYYRDALARQLH